MIKFFKNLFSAVLCNREGCIDGASLAYLNASTSHMDLEARQRHLQRKPLNLF